MRESRSRVQLSWQDGSKVKWAWAGGRLWEARRGRGHFRKLKSPPKEQARCCCKQVGDEAKVKQEILSGRCICK